MGRTGFVILLTMFWLLSGAGPGTSAPYDHDDEDIIQQGWKLKQMYQQQNGIQKLADRLLAIDRRRKLDRALVALSKNLNKVQKNVKWWKWRGTKANHDRTAKLFDELTGRNQVRATLLALDTLLYAVESASTSSYYLTDEVRSFPDQLCRRAASLLDHKDPVVQAMAEWTLSLRVRKQNIGANKINDFFFRKQNVPGWYQKWKERERSKDLRDNYGRQLVHLNRHRTLEGVSEGVEDVADRIKRMLQDPTSQDAPDVYKAFKKKVRKVKNEISEGRLVEAHSSYIDLRRAAREVIKASRSDFPTEGFVFFTNPSIPGGDWNVNVPVRSTMNEPFGNLYVKRSSNPGESAEPLLKRNDLEAGSIRGMDLHWNGDEVLFSYWPQPIDGSKPYGWDKNKKTADLHTLNMETGERKQITDDPNSNDIEPTFVPDGGYIFASDRPGYGNQCAGPFLQKKRTTSLYRLQPNGGGPIALSHNKDFDRHPHVLNNGMIVFMHWEYQERGYLKGQNAWQMRPDGTSMGPFYKQHITRPYSIRDVRQAPDSRRCVATVQGHHSGHQGHVVVFDPSKGINNSDAARLLTPGCGSIEGGLGPIRGQVVKEGGVQNDGGHYINPFPMSENGFLVAHEMGVYKKENDYVRGEFGIYYVDVWGNRELLHKDPNLSTFRPIPLRKREKPPALPNTVDREQGQKYATAYVENVYKGMPNVEKGEVEYLRLNQRLFTPAPANKDEEEYSYEHLKYRPGDSTASHFSYWNWAPTRTIGTVPVNEDGSAYFKVPASVPVYLQALDENFMEIRRMRSNFTLQSGEFRSCTGCHADRQQKSGNRLSYTSAIKSKEPKTPTPPPWGMHKVLDFEKDIQPIFDRYCVSCHGQQDPAGGLDFSSRKIGGFNQSYRTIMGLSPDEPTPIFNRRGDEKLKWHKALHPEAADDSYVTGGKAKKQIRKMEQNQWPGMLVSITDVHGDSELDPAYAFGSSQSKLTQVLLNDERHIDVRSELSETEWRKLLAWVDYNAVYHSTVVNVSEWKEKNQLTRVEYELPSPWYPFDEYDKPTYFNTADPDTSPNVPEKIKHWLPGDQMPDSFESDSVETKK